MSRILITSISSKYSLYKEVRDIAGTLNAEVFLTDRNTSCLGARFPGGHFLRQPSQGFDGIIQLVKEHAINLVIPSRDEECRIFSSHINEFRRNACDLLAPRHGTVELCLNKELFNSHLEGLGLRPLPLILTPVDDDFPIFMRPKIGAGSVGCMKIESKTQFERIDSEAKANHFFHPFISDDEFSVDVVTDAERHYFDCVIRKRVLVINGESKVTETAKIPAIKNAVKTLISSFSDIGHFVVQLFYSPQHGIRFIETNPRFGGASSLSQHVGLNSLKYLIYKKLGVSSYTKWTSRICSNPTRMTRLSHDQFEVIPHAPLN